MVKPFNCKIMKKIFFVLAILALGLTACNTNEIDTIETPEAVAASTDAPVCYFNLPASFDGDAATKAVTIGEVTATSSFKATDKIYVYIERDSDTPAFGYDESSSELVPLTISNINRNTCDLSGALKFYHEGSGFDYEAYTPQENDRVHLLYNHNGNLDNPVYPYFEFYSMSGGKDGYVDMGYFYYWGANHFDFAEAVMKVTKVSGDADTGYSLTLDKVDDPTDIKVSFKSLQSMFRQRLSFTDENGDPATPTITKFRISSANNKIVYSYYPFYNNNTPHYDYRDLEIGSPYSSPVISGDGDIYFPLMFNDENKNDALIFTAYDNAENVYTLTKNAPASGFANGKYYYGGAALAWHHNMRPTVTGTTATPSYGNYTIDDNPVNITISGYSEDYKFALNHGGTVTLNNVTATHTSTFMREYVDPAEDLLVVLTGANSIKAAPYDCISVQGGGSLKLSCTGASATLTVTVPYSSGCGIYGANYKPSDATSDPTANRYDITTTEYDVSAQLAAPGFTVTRSACVDNGDGTYTWTYTVEDHRVHLNSLSGNYEAQNGDVLTGTLAGNYQISIADGATVTLDGVTINGTSGFNWAGLTCNGDATIVLADGTTNAVKGFSRYYPGIYVPSGKKLIIQGSTGKLNASSNGAGAGIGGGYIHSGDITSGNIIINGGIITATGGSETAGIGGGYAASGVNTCGTITITGGTVTAYGGENAPGIGGAASCGKITISGGTVKATGGQYGAGIGCRKDGSCTDGIEISGTANVTATGGEYAAGIGSAYGLSRNSTCGDILIDGTATVKATGGEYAAGIGSGLGHDNSSQSICGTITIKGTVTSVIATKGNPAYDSIGKGTFYSTCGAVFIEDPSKVTVN